MAGHSKWANIKHRKGRQDAKRGKIFSRIIKELTVASKLGGAVPEDNPRLRTALDKALSSNIPKDTIKKAIQRGVGGSGTQDLEEASFEGYGPGGVAILVESMTDNNNRTVAEVRHAFVKAGGNLGTTGSVSYLFVKKGLIRVNKNCDQDKVMELAIESGAEDIEISQDSSISICVSPNNFEKAENSLNDAGIDIDSSEITFVPENTVTLNLNLASKVCKLLESLEDLDDTQNVHSNADFPDEMIDNLDLQND